MQSPTQRRKAAKKNLSASFAPLRLCVRILLIVLLIGRAVPVSAFQTTSAEAIFAEAEVLRSEQREDANLKAIEKFREAATAFQNSGDLRSAEHTSELQSR